MKCGPLLPNNVNLISRCITEGGGRKGRDGKGMRDRERRQRDRKSESVGIGEIGWDRESMRGGKREKSID